MVLVKGVLGPGDGPVGVNPKNITNMPQPSSGRELPNYQNSDSRAIYSKTDLRIYIYMGAHIYTPYHSMYGPFTYIRVVSVVVNMTVPWSVWDVHRTKGIWALSFCGID